MSASIKGTHKVQDAEILTVIDPDGRRYEIETGSVWIDWERVYDEALQAYRMKASVREAK